MAISIIKTCMSIKYDGWELNEFDNANNFRNYQFERILKYIKGQTAEIGPGTGSNIKKYINQISSLHLYEPSKNLFKVLKKKFKHNKIKIINKPIEIKKKKFDTIIYLDVLEHIQNDEVEVKKALKNLKKGGYLIINVPAFNLLYSEFDKDVGHFKRYKKNDLKKILTNQKYNKVEMEYYDSIGFILVLLSKIVNVNYKKNFNKKIYLWNNLIPISKLIDKCVFNSFGKSLICVIKK